MKVLEGLEKAIEIVKEDIDPKDFLVSVGEDLKTKLEKGQEELSKKDLYNLRGFMGVLEGKTHTKEAKELEERYNQIVNEVMTEEEQEEIMFEIMEENLTKEEYAQLMLEMITGAIK